MDEHTQMEQTPISLIRLLYEEVFQHGNLAIIATVFSADFVDHSTPHQPRGYGGVRDYLSDVRTGFPNMQVTLEEVSAGGEYVVVRTIWRGTHLGTYEGVPPSGKQVTRTLLQLFRVVDGVIAEEWNEGDGLLDTAQKNSA